MDKHKGISVERLRAAIDYNPETGALTWRERPGNNYFNSVYAGMDAFTTKTKKGYRRGFIDGVRFMAHVVCWAIHYGEWPQYQIDHKGRDGSNNRISNLRQASNTKNCRNQGTRKNNSSGHSGVSYHNRDKVFQAYINNDHGRKYLGSFPTLEAAVAARKDAEQALGYGVDS